MSEARDEIDGLWFELEQRSRVEAALEEEAAEAGFVRVEPGELAPYGRWLQGEEDPTVRRYAIAPAGERWTAVFPSHPDWDHEHAGAVADRLGCAAACLMLHDGDVLTLHLHEGEELLVAHCSSPVHFDREPRAEGLLDFDPEDLLPYCRDGLDANSLRELLTPPGRIDTDGRAAFRQAAEALELGPHSALCYAELVDETGLKLREEFADFHHLAFQLDEGATAEPPAPSGEAEVLPFPGRRKPPRA